MAPAELEKLLEDCTAKLGVHLIDIVVKGDGNGKTVELFVDSETGVTTETCSQVSREVGGLIEASGIVRGPYRLTVSSPGIDRPLKYLWQFRKHVGRDMLMKVRTGEGVHDVTGRLESISDAIVTVESRQTGVRQSIPFSEVVEARVKAPW